MKRKLALLLAMTMLLSMLTACGNTAPAAEETTTPPETSEAAQSATQTVTDMAGREVEIPTTITSVYCSVPTAEAMVCTLLPDLMMGWVNTLSEDNAQYLPENLKALPVLGGWMGQKVTADIEAIIEAAPDVIIYMSNISANGEYSVAEDIQNQTDIPVLVVFSDFEYTAEVYRWLGGVLGVAERGEALASYCEEKMTHMTQLMAKVPDSEKLSFYYAEGNEGLSTEPAGGHHIEVQNFLGITSVADVEEQSGQGMTEVSMEQVINWNPDIIIVSGSTLATYDTIMSSDVWGELSAVQAGKVYTTPVAPFNWFDRPPNIMRVLGMQWLAAELYPTYVDYDINEEISDFFQLFYNVDLTDAQLTSLQLPDYNP